MKKILFSRNSDIIQPLRLLMCEQKHETLIMWALECTPFILTIFEKHFPLDLRPKDAIMKTYAWAKGDIKMPEAKRAILECHRAAAEAKNFPAAQAAARAIGHAASTVHVETHAIGLILYGLTALVYDQREDEIQKYLDYFYDTLIYYQDNVDKVNIKWAPFITKEKPNKEKLLLQKEKAMQ